MIISETEKTPSPTFLETTAAVLLIIALLLLFIPGVLRNLCRLVGAVILLGLGLTLLH